MSRAHITQNYTTLHFTRFEHSLTFVVELQAHKGKWQTNGQTNTTYVQWGDSTPYT